MKNPLETVDFLIDIKQNEKAKQVLDIMKPLASSILELDQLGKNYAEIREFKDCLEIAYKIYDQCQTTKDKWNARVNIIRAYLNLNEPEQALKYIEINERINPKDHPNRMDKAMVFFLLNRKKEGEKILRDVLSEPHDEDIDKRIKFNLGTYELANGNFKDGLYKFLCEGRKLNIWQKYEFPKEKFWNGGVQPGKTILICSEGGIGDEIIDVRFVHHFKRMGMNPLWYTTRKDLADVFNRCGLPTITNLKEVPSDFIWTYGMQVPVFLNVEENDLWHGPYLKPKRVKEQLPGNKKVGIKHMGNPKYDQDLHRTIPLEQMINAIPEDCTIYSFNIDEEINHPRVMPLKNYIQNWDDTLDYIDQMDYMVSSCTSIAHAAAAIGKKTYVIVPILNYYVWAKPEPHSSWYDTHVRILRQQEYNNWNAPLVELKDLLYNMKTVKPNYNILPIKLVSITTDEVIEDVPCDGCTKCCETLAPYLTPEEISSGKYPLSFTQPDDALLNFDSEAGPVVTIFRKPSGGCGMFVDGKCSIYDDRPKSCRQFDCRKGHHPKLIEFAKEKFNINEIR